MKTTKTRTLRIGTLALVLLLALLMQSLFGVAALASETPTNEMDGSKIERIKIEWVTPDSAAANPAATPATAPGPGPARWAAGSSTPTGPSSMRALSSASAA